MANLERESQDACAAALRAQGFVPKRRGLLLQPGADKTVSGFLGLNLATWELPERLLVNPVVGVRHGPLEKLLVDLAGWSAPVAVPNRPLGYLTPRNDFVQWEFPAGGDLAAIAADLAGSVATYGQPFIDTWSDWSYLSANIADAGGLLDVERFLVLPLIAALNGERAAAEALVQQELDRIGGSEDMYAVSYREFARKFAKIG
jgi:hypothetical protein